MKKIIILSFILISHVVYGQTNIHGTISGTIVDSKIREPLPGANIMLMGTMIGTSSDLEGKFIIQRIPPGTYQLKATMMGFKSQIVRVTVEAQKTAIAAFTLEETVIETQGVVVTAGKKAQSFQDVSNSVSLVLAEHIEKRNRLYLDDILEYTPGVNITHGDVNIRGSSGFSLGAGSRVLLLVDGIPMMPGDSGDIKWDIIPLSQIERVEVVKGAGSALYGSHALGGVINIISKEPSLKPNTHVKFMAGLYDKPSYPEWEWTDKALNFNQIDVTHSRKIKNLGVLISGGRLETTGYQQNGHKTNWNFLGRADYKFNSQSNLTIQSNWANSKYGEIFMWRNQNDVFEMPIPSVGDWSNSTKFSLNTIYRQLINRKFTTKARASYFKNFWKHHYHDNDDFSEAQKFGLELQGDYLLSGKHSLTFGIEGIYDLTNSAMFGDHNGSTWATFMQDDIRLGNLFSMVVGLRYDYHWVDVGMDDNQLNPKFGMTFKPSVMTTLRGSVGRGFRSPSMAEMFTETTTSGFKVIPNPELKAESAWSYEIGFNQILSKNLIIDFAAFHNDYWNFIEPEPDEQNTVQFINVNRARIRGIEFSAQSSWWRKQINALISYTLLDPKDLETNEVLAYRPRHMLTASLDFNKGIFSTGFDFRFVSRLDSVKVYPDEDRIDQKIFNGRLGLNFGNYVLTFNVNNIFNYSYMQVERNMAPVRHYTITFMTNL